MAVDGGTVGGADPLTASRPKGAMEAGVGGMLVARVGKGGGMSDTLGIDGGGGGGTYGAGAKLFHTGGGRPALGSICP